MRWVIERLTEDDPFPIALENNGIQFDEVSVRPFTNEIVGLLEYFPDERVFVRGPFGIAEGCAMAGLSPVVWTGPELSEKSVQEALGELYLNNDGRSMLIEDIKNLSLGPIFIKPATDTKEFSGQVIQGEDAESWLNNMFRTGYLTDKDRGMEVFVSSVKKTGCEWRMFVVNGKVITGSCYHQYQRTMPERWVPDAVTEFAERVISVYDPLPGYALDIAQVESGDYKVIEMNTINHAGAYLADVNLLVPAIQTVLDNMEMTDEMEMR